MLKFPRTFSRCFVSRKGDGTKEIRRFEVTIPSIEKISESIKPISRIPGYTSFPWVGTAWIFYPLLGKFSHENVHFYDRHKYDRFGEIARDVYSGSNIISCYNDKDFETVLKNEGKTPVRGLLTSLLAYRKLRREWYETVGVLLTENQEWYDLRFKLQKHLMKPRTVDRYIEPITNVAHDLCGRIIHYRDNNKEVDNVQSELFKWSLESVAYVGLEKRLGCLDMNSSSSDGPIQMIESMQTAFACMNRMESSTGNSIQLWKWLPTPTWRKFVKAKDKFSEIAFREVKVAMDLLKAKDPTEEFQPTILQAMLSSPEIKPCEAMTMVMDMLMGGIDTTSNAASFLLYHLATNPDKQEKLYQNIKQVLPTDTDVLTADILSNMRYLKLCLKESFRMDPVARGVIRIIDRDMVLSGYHIPKGTPCLLMLQVVGRLERYFHNPEQFIPERWDERSSKPAPYLAVPFGFGTRSCIGRRIAELEIQTLIITLLRKFKIEYYYGDVQMKNRMVNTPDRSLKFAFIDRN